MTTTTSSPPHLATPARARIGGLDGLRAIAVVGVMLYHADVTWFRGGFIGVDIFFVLSGYLVTTIVMDGLEKRGGLGFRRFWGARFRRLEPAQITMMVVITIVVAIGFRDLLSTLRAQVIRGVIDEVAAESAIEVWGRLGVERIGASGLLDRVWALRQNLTAYDATYVAVAEALDAALLTADGRLARAPGPRCPITVVRR